MSPKKEISYRKKSKNKKAKNAEEKITIIEEKDKFPKKDINIGVQILRMIYSFLVIEVHFGRGNQEVYDFSWRYIDFYVTSFFLISFYFSYNTFSSRHISKIKERFLRLLYPYILWPILIYIRHNFNDIKNRNIRIDSYLLKRFYIQYLLGNNIHGISWFLFNLILLSLFICIIIFMFKDHHMISLYILFILGSIYNYTKLHDALMKQFNRFPIQHSMEILNETIIFSITGYILGYFDILNVLLKLNKFIFIFFSPIFIIVKWHQEVFDLLPRFNVIFNDFFITSIFIFFGTLPFHLCKNSLINKFIKIISQHTGGIYYLHTQCYDILINKYRIMAPGTVKCCLVIYFSTFLFCDIATRILKKFRLRYLFN